MQEVRCRAVRVPRTKQLALVTVLRLLPDIDSGHELWYIASQIWNEIRSQVNAENGKLESMRNLYLAVRGAR